MEPRLLPLLLCSCHHGVQLLVLLLQQVAGVIAGINQRTIVPVEWLLLLQQLIALEICEQFPNVGLRRHCCYQRIASRHARHPNHSFQIRRAPGNVSPHSGINLGCVTCGHRCRCQLRRLQLLLQLLVHCSAPCRRGTWPGAGCPTQLHEAAGELPRPSGMVRLLPVLLWLLQGMHQVRERAVI